MTRSDWMNIALAFCLGGLAAIQTQALIKRAQAEHLGDWIRAECQGVREVYQPTGRLWAVLGSCAGEFVLNWPDAGTLWVGNSEPVPVLAEALSGFASSEGVSKVGSVKRITRAER